jgi:hypothetical protein
MSSNKMQELISLYAQSHPEDKYPNFMKALSWAVYIIRHRINTSNVSS